MSKKYTLDNLVNEDLIYYLKKIVKAVIAIPLIKRLESGTAHIINFVPSTKVIN